MLIKNGNYWAETFGNMSEFLRTIDGRENNKQFGTFSSDSEPDEFTDFLTYEQSEEKAINGVSDIVRRFGRAKTSASAGNRNVRKTRNYYYGYAPNVPAAIIGLPKSMRQIKTIPVKSKTVRLIYSPCGNSDISRDDVARAGECIVELICALESSGYRVKLDVLAASSEMNRITGVCLVEVKGFSDRLDLTRLSFPLTSSAFQRRLGFRWRETLPEFPCRVGMGYGRTMDFKELTNALNQLGLTKQNALVCNYYLVKQIGYNVDKLAEKIGVKLYV